jgi:hypothetical protein
MPPPSATDTGAAVHSIGNDKVATATHEPGLTKKQEAVKSEGIAMPDAPQFEDKYKEREFQKGRLALAFRIFAKLGFDEGVAGHITLRVSSAPLLNLWWVLGT